MKLFFKLIIILFFSQPVFSENIRANYLVKTKGITIGSLSWSVDISEKTYQTSIELKNRGFLSKLFKFEGFYKTGGKIKNEKLVPKNYIQKWKTNKKNREVKIIFENHKITELIIKPKEREWPRIDYLKLIGYSDPLTSFMNILLYNISANTTDGRRVYVLSPKKNEGYTKILVKEFKNIWADHKRNDLEYLEVFKNNSGILPTRINISFGGFVYSLIEE